MIEQKLADYFIGLKKTKADDSIYDLRNPKVQIPLIGHSQPQEEFILDINKNTIRLEKYTVQNRVRKSIGLIRVDFGVGGHTNPDRSIILGPHIHVYREGYDLKWAYSLPFTSTTGIFVDQGNLLANLGQLYSLCNIVEPPQIQGTLL